MAPEVRKDIEARMKTLDHQTSGYVGIDGNCQHIQKLRRGQASTHEEQGAAANGGISGSATPRKRKIPVKKAASGRWPSLPPETDSPESDDEGDYILSIKGAEPVTPLSGCTNKAKS
ncbi:hypothetical protein E4U13_001543 [Claviceps humidiphila]|uniref:Uncharacterized protein n=1 Tax=Claviceps humidiphila TaxID=1294629 RepID=A0A9P7TR57_9HYPO|nr:hypothetical protein E4U13_001543 [Claviceps humidiphila]